MRKPKKKIRKLSEASGCKRKLIFFKCGPDSFFGGLGDRIRGISTLFWISLMSFKEFRVSWTKPVDIFDFFKSKIDLRINTENISISKAHRWVDFNLQDRLCNSNFPEWNEEVLEITTNHRVLDCIIHGNSFPNKKVLRMIYPWIDNTVRITTNSMVMQFLLQIVKVRTI